MNTDTLIGLPDAEQPGGTNWKVELPAQSWEPIMHLNLASASTTGASPLMDDPLAADCPNDPIVLTTRRAISRVAFVAAETASRFEREDIHYDPAAWLFAPRRLFDGEAAIDACLRPDAFRRAMLLHGLSLGMDADPDALLLADDDDDDDGDGDGDDLADAGHMGPESWGEGTELHNSKPVARLYSAVIDCQSEGRVHQAFHASTAFSVSEFRDRLSMIFGIEAAHIAVVREGVNPSIMMVQNLVAPELLDTLIGDRSYPGRRVVVTAERVIEVDA